MSTRDEKRARVVGKKPQGRPGKKWLMPAVFGTVFLVLLGIGLARNTIRPAGSAVPSGQVEAVDYARGARIEQIPIQVAQADGTITVPLAEIRGKKLVGFSFTGPNGTLPLLSYIAPSGKVVTAVSMCEPCNSTTFHIEGDQLVCNTCGTRWDLENLGGISGGCLSYPPDAFPNAVAGDNVVIQEASVASWTPRV